MKTIRPAPDYIEDYKQDYGYIGPALCAAVAKARTQPTTLTTPSTTSTTLTTNQNTVSAAKSVMQSGERNSQSNVHFKSPEQGNAK